MTDGLYSRDAERACLGAALLDNSFMRSSLDCLSVNDFGLSAHRELFALMLQSDQEGLPFDILTLVGSLQQQNKQLEHRDIAYLDSLTDGVVPHPGLIKRHAETVIRFSRLRQIQKFADRIGHQAYERGADPEHLLQKLEAGIEGLRTGCDLDGNLTPVHMQKLPRRADLLTLATVEAKEVEWLWKPYLPIGMLAILNGDPGAGKTFIALQLLLLSLSARCHTPANRECPATCCTSVSKTARSTWCGLDLIPSAVTPAAFIFCAVPSSAMVSGLSEAVCGFPMSRS